MSVRTARTSRARRALAAAVVAVLATTASTLFAPTARAQSDAPKNGSPVNTAVVQNTKDGSSLFKLAFKVRTITHATTVAPGNAAIAIASCTNCQTVAIAVQVVFVIGNPQTFAPENGAVAVNSDCSFCDTLATAFQFIVQSAAPVRLTPDGRHALHDIHKALEDLDKSDLDVFTIRSKVDELMQQLAEVLATDVEPRRATGADAGAVPASTSSSSGSTTTTVTTSTSGSTSTTSTSTSTSTTTSTLTSSSSTPSTSSSSASLSSSSSSAS